MRKFSKFRVLKPGLIAAVIGFAGCNKPGDVDGSNPPAPVHAAAVSTTNPAGAGPTLILFDDQKDGVQFQYNSNWTPKPDKDYVLHLVPADGTDNRRIDFDIPDLPPHFPGMIRLGLIEHGYVGDLKDSHKDLHVDSSADHPMAQEASARLVETSWSENGKPMKCVGLLIMRKDHVYILSSRSEAGQFSATRSEFDKVAASLHWTK